MRVVCAWCKRQLKSCEGYVAGDPDKVSHGICPECVREMFQNPDTWVRSGGVDLGLLRLLTQDDPWELWTDIGGEG